MSKIKRLFKRNTHNAFFKVLAGFGRSLNRLYENRNHDIHSNGELTVLKKISKFKPEVIIDGGANVGDYALAINQFNPAARIFSFEPVQGTFDELKKNVKEHSNIVPIQKGLFKKNCTQEINTFKSNEHSSLYEIQGSDIRSEGYQNIELIRGDDWIKENQLDQIDFLKIDVEGAEFDALVGFEEAIRNGKIKAIQFEYGYINISTKKLLIDYYNFFEEHDYLLGKIFPKTVEFRKYEFKYEDFLGPNFIAVKKSESELIETLKRRG